VYDSMRQDMTAKIYVIVKKTIFGSLVHSGFSRDRGVCLKANRGRYDSLLIGSIDELDITRYNYG
jgi:hypothetical protein